MIILTRLLTLCFLLLAGQAHALTLLSEDFEGSIASLRAKYAACSYDVGISWNDGQPQDQDGAQKYAGSFSMKNHFNGTQYDPQPHGGGFCDFDYPDQTKREIWITWYHRFDTGFKTAGGANATPPVPGGLIGTATKGLYTFMRSPSTGVVRGWVFHYFYGSRQLTLSAQGIADAAEGAYGTENLWHNVSGWSEPDNVWTCYEVQYKLNTAGQANGEYRQYTTDMTNGGSAILRSQYTGRRFVDGTSQAPNDLAWFRTRYYRQDGLGDMWYDNVSVTDTRIGCGTAPPPPPPDITPPPAPSGTPTATSSTPGTVTVGWSFVSASDLAGYTIRRCTGAACSPSTVAATASANATSAVITGLTGGTVYGFAVNAFDQTGNQSGYTPTVYVTVASTPPSSGKSLSVNSSGLYVLNGAQVTLLGFSYFDFLDYKTSDLNTMAALGYNNVRVFVNWRDHIDATQSVCTSTGALDAGRLATANAFMDYTESLNMTVTMVILSENSSTLMTDDTKRRACVTNIVNAFKTRPLIKFDVVQEYNVAAITWADSLAELATYISAARTECPTCLIYASGTSDFPTTTGIAPQDTTSALTAAMKSNITSKLTSGGETGLAVHDYRSANWWAVTGARVTAYRQHLASIGLSAIPLHFDEPCRDDGYSAECDATTATQWIQSVVDGFAAGAAEIVWHTNKGFDLTTTMISQLTSKEQAVYVGIPAALNGATTTEPSLLQSYDFGSALGGYMTGGIETLDTPTIASARLRATNTAAQALAVYNGSGITVPSNHLLSVAVPTATGSNPLHVRVGVRMQTGTDYSGYDCRFSFNPDTVSIARKDNDNPVTLVAGVSQALAPGDTLWCSANGSTISLGMGSVTSTPILTTVDTTYSTGKPYLYLNTAGEALTSLELDNLNLYEFIAESASGITAGTTAVSANGSGVSTRTVSVTVPAGNDRLLVCGTGARSTTAGNLVVSGMTYNGSAMTKAREDITGDLGGAEFAGSSIWYLLAPTVTTANAVATWTGTISNIATAWCLPLSGVDPSTPIGPVNGSFANSGAAAISTSVTPLVDDAWVIDSTYSGNDTVNNAVSAGQVIRTNRSVTGGSTDQVSVSTEGPITPAAATAMGWTPDSSTFYAQSVVTINPVPVVPPCTQSVSSVVASATGATVTWDTACVPSGIRVYTGNTTADLTMASFPGGVYTRAGGWVVDNGGFVCMLALDAQGAATSAEQQCDSVTEFVPAVDTTAPTLTIAFPVGELPNGTTGTTIGVTVSEQAECRQGTSNVAYDSLPNTMAMVSLQATYAVTGLSTGTTTFYVACRDAAADPNTSAILAVPVTVAASTADTTPPTTVTNLAVAAISPTQIRLTHDLSTDAGGPPTYEAWVSQDDVTYARALQYAGIPADLGNLSPGGTYYVKVLAVDLSINPAAAYSNTVTITLQNAPDTVAPSDLTNLLVLGSFQNSFALQWDVCTDDRGQAIAIIEQCQGAGCSDFDPLVVTITGQTVIVDLAAGTTYRFRGKCFDGTNSSANYSPTIEVTTTMSGQPVPRLAVPYPGGITAPGRLTGPARLAVP